MENSYSPVKSNVLIMNVTDNGIVCTVESSRTEDAVLCFLSHERAALLDIVVPWMVKSKARPGKPAPTPRQWQGVKEA